MAILGIALGFIGSVVVFLAVYPIVVAPLRFGLGEVTGIDPAVLLVVSLMYLVCAFAGFAGSAFAVARQAKGPTLMTAAGAVVFILGVLLQMARGAGVGLPVAGALLLFGGFLARRRTADTRGGREARGA